MGTTAHCYAVAGGSILRGCADYTTSAYPIGTPRLTTDYGRRDTDRPVHHSSLLNSEFSKKIHGGLLSNGAPRS
jgi:hypothetical protein